MIVIIAQKMPIQDKKIVMVILGAMYAMPMMIMTVFRIVLMAQARLVVIPIHAGMGKQTTVMTIVYVDLTLTKGIATATALVMYVNHQIPTMMASPII
jgi:hypothetical protein